MRVVLVGGTSEVDHCGEIVERRGVWQEDKKDKVVLTMAAQNRNVLRRDRPYNTEKPFLMPAKLLYPVLPGEIDG